MKSNRAKVLHELDGRPLVNHVCETALKLDPASIYIVVGHQADEVKRMVLEELGDEKIGFCVQERQFGTGDAVNDARRDLENRESNLLIHSGDVPMLPVETLNQL